MTSLKIYWFLIIAFLLILVEGCRKDDIIVDEPEDEPEIEVEEDPGCLGVYTDFFYGLSRHESCLRGLFSSLPRQLVGVFEW